MSKYFSAIITKLIGIWAIRNSVTILTQMMPFFIAIILCYKSMSFGLPLWQPVFTLQILRFKSDIVRKFITGFYHFFFEGFYRQICPICTYR